MIQYPLLDKLSLIFMLVFYFGLSISQSQPEVDSEPTAETEIICYAAQKQWVCAPADQKQQAHDKALKLAEQNQSNELVSESVADSSVEIKTMDNRLDFSQQVLENPADQRFQPGSVEQQISDFVPRTGARGLNESSNDTKMATESREEVAEESNIQFTTDPITTNETTAALPRPSKPLRSVNDFKSWQTEHAEKWSFQVVGAANRNQLEGFVKQHNLQQRNYAIAKTQVNNADWWIVLVGLFNSRDEALSQRNQLPTELAPQAWVRQVRMISVQAD